MAKVLIAAFRNTNGRLHRGQLEALCKRLAPDNLDPQAPYIVDSEGVVTCVYNPQKNLVFREGSVCLGHAVPVDGSSTDSILDIGAPAPEGTFCLFRLSQGVIEVISDYAGSRSIWYYCSDEVFMASSSQRMLVAAIGDFSLNPKAIAWFLSTGTLGPGFSWDSRIRYLPRNSRLQFNRRAWGIELDCGGEIEIDERPQSFEQARANLECAVRNVCQDIDIEGLEWVLALSGGMDSRSILYFLKNRQGFSAVTWSTERARKDAFGDASIAELIAKASGIEHSFASMDCGSTTFPILIQRVVAAGEARTDHFAGYMDGLALWAELGKVGKGVIRGYDAFGRKAPAHTEFQARLGSELCYSSEVLRLSLPQDLAITEADLPEEFLRKEGESLGNWRDRLWLQFRTPFLTAALDDIKVAYVEIMNPLLFRRIVEIVRRLPLSFRESKYIFSSIVKQYYPEVPFARSVSIHNHHDVVSLHGFREYALDCLSSCVPGVPDGFRRSVAKSIEAGRSRERFRRIAVVTAKRWLPLSAENLLRAHVRPPKISNRRLAMRLLCVRQANEMFSLDCKVMYRNQ